MTTGRAFDRLVNFSDAVVAVAVTLLVLPIIDIRGNSSEDTVWQIIQDHFSQLFAYVFTFIVVAILWQVHSRVFSRMRGFDATIFMLNVGWLLGIALLPWASALYAEGIGVARADFSGGEGFGGAGMFYWGITAWISVMPGLMAWHASRHSELIDPEAPVVHTHPLRPYIFPVIFIIFGIVTLVHPALGSWLPIVLIPITIVFRRLEKRDESRSSSS